MRLGAILTIVVATAAIPACADDSSGGASIDDQSIATVETTGAQPEAMSAEVICERLSIDSVASDTGLDVTRTIPDDSATPHCSYEYTTDDDSVSELTVSVMRSEDLDGLSGSDAFDRVVQINTSAAGGTVDTQDVSAGDAAIRISNASVHVGVLQLGDRVLTVVIPAADVGTDAADRLISTMATTLG